MKILYVFDTQDHETFTLSELPETVEILRTGKKPVMFRPAVMQIQDIYTRLNEAEALLTEIQKNTSWTIHDDSIPNPQVRKSIDEYFSKYKQ